MTARRRLLALVIPAMVLLAGCTDILNPGARAGEAAPAFELVDLAGNSHNLTSLAGHIIVLDFMASSCGPCRLQMPHLSELNETDPDVRILSVSVDPGETNETLAKFRDEFAAPWPFAKGHFFGIREDYGVITLPKVVVITPEATIAFASKPGTAVSRDDLFDAIAGAKGAGA